MIEYDFLMLMEAFNRNFLISVGQAKFNAARQTAQNAVRTATGAAKARARAALERLEKKGAESFGSKIVRGWNGDQAQFDTALNSYLGKEMDASRRELLKSDITKWWQGQQAATQKTTRGTVRKSAIRVGQRTKAQADAAREAAAAQRRSYTADDLTRNGQRFKRGAKPTMTNTADIQAAEEQRRAAQAARINERLAQRREQLAAAQEQQRRAAQEAARNRRKEFWGNVWDKTKQGGSAVGRFAKNTAIGTGAVVGGTGLLAYSATQPSK